ncbi:universal stress protein [Nocardia rhizosphaerihabitans]|uniref:Universal stress protein n=1 Tax=Nocardia rhizosphaerihabitans TaxID=1691570 RepID=A0ABQ2KCE2_9NOCA|nr:universal stress protein [Nocardia rhizosphaerihabitans]GGN78213.1 universal stress protein [Nocardia rhizosphaerihabitans]
MGSPVAGTPDRESAPVVVGIDGHSDSAVRWAARAAVARRRPLRLLCALEISSVQSVFGRFDLFTPSVPDTVRAQGAERLQHARRLAGMIDPDLAVAVELTEEEAADALVARSGDAHLTVIGAGRGGSRLGSTLLAVTAHATGTVVVVRGDADARAGLPVVVGVDGSDLSRAAAAAAFAEAALRGVPLVAVHTWDDLRFEKAAALPDPVDDAESIAESHRLLTEVLAPGRAEYPAVEVEPQVYRYSPAHHLLEWSAEAQLVVTGSRGRGGFRGLLLGSTSNALVQHAQCPVMVVHRGTEHGR